MEMTAQILTAASALGVGYLLGYLNHGLASRRESDSRRRVFRGTIRSIAARIEPGHFINLYKLYPESVLEVRSDCSKISDDIRFWRRRRFTETFEQYCAFKQSDIVPPPPSAAATPDEMAARKKKHHEAKAMLAETLERMIEYAK